MKAELDIRWRIGADQLRDVDPTLFRLLEAIQQGDNLRAAAQRAGVSYRHAWGLLQFWAKEFGCELVQLERGRGASMLPLGECLLQAAQRSTSRLAPSLQSLAAELEHDLSRLTDAAQPARISASHDIALQKLVELLNQQAPPRFNLQHRGSLESLRQLASGHCDIAGFHVPTDPLIPDISAAFRQLLPGASFELVHFAGRSQGLILPRDNPQAIFSLDDLINSGALFVNRQAGSGTRLLFDALLARNHIDTDRINGYGREEFTHQAVAAMIASGHAQAGFGIAHAATEFGLAFVPLAIEHYLLAWNRNAAGSEWLTTLTKFVHDRASLNALGTLTGYDLSDCGQPTSLSAR